MPTSLPSFQSCLQRLRDGGLDITATNTTFTLRFADVPEPFTRSYRFPKAYNVINLGAFVSEAFTTYICLVLERQGLVIDQSHPLIGRAKWDGHAAEIFGRSAFGLGAESAEARLVLAFRIGSEPVQASRFHFCAWPTDEIIKASWAEAQRDHELLLRFLGFLRSEKIEVSVENGGMILFGQVPIEVVGGKIVHLDPSEPLPDKVQKLVERFERHQPLTVLSDSDPDEIIFGGLELG
jgi:hypothetical protein